MKTSGNTILITGGGSGIGEALAHRWHDQGNDVIVTGRRRDALDRSIQGRARMSAVELDVDDPDAIKAFAIKMRSQHPALNVLVNNAGIMRGEDATGLRDLTDAQATITTNLLGPIRMIDALVDHLKSQPDAAIVTVSSGLAFVPLVATPTYSRRRPPFIPTRSRCVSSSGAGWRSSRSCRRPFRPNSRPANRPGRATCRSTPSQTR